MKKTLVDRRDTQLILELQVAVRQLGTLCSRCLPNLDLHFLDSHFLGDHEFATFHQTVALPDPLRLSHSIDLPRSICDTGNWLVTMRFPRCGLFGKCLWSGDRIAWAKYTNGDLGRLENRFPMFTVNVV